MMAATSYGDLETWRVAMELVVSAYTAAGRFPKHETYGLASQLRRASVSIPANIAEGYGRLHRGDYIRHVSIAMGSLREPTTLLDISARLGYLTAPQLAKTPRPAESTGRLLYVLSRRLQHTSTPAKSARTPKPNPEPRTPLP